MKTQHFFLVAQRQGNHTSSNTWRRTVTLLIALVIIGFLALIVVALLTNNGYDVIAGGKSFSISM